MKFYTKYVFFFNYNRSLRKQDNKLNLCKTPHDIYCEQASKTKSYFRVRTLEQTVCNWTDIDYSLPRQMIEPHF